MKFTVRTLAKSLAGYLSDKFPGVTFYEDPNQQETKTPCFFLQVRHSNIVPKTNERYLRTIGLDLVYLERYNLPNLQEILQKICKKLAERPSPSSQILQRSRNWKRARRRPESERL